MKNIISKIRKLLEEYSPIALLILVAPFFLPVDRHLHRTLLLLFCAFPGMLLTMLNCKTILKNPVHLCILIFVAYFSAQDIRGSLPLTPEIVRQVLTLAIIIIFPAFMISYATPDRKLYPAAIRLILLASVMGSIYSLVSFYSNNPFPAARFELTTGTQLENHPTTSAMRCGFAAVLTGAFFLQSGAKLKRTDSLVLACLPILLAATLYTHNRSGVMALLAVIFISVFGIRKRIKKTLLLYAVAAATVLVYFASLHTAATLLAASPQQSQLEQQLTKCPLRPAGFAVTGEAGTASITGRFDIWRDLYSRMDSVKIWMFGHGLGQNNFVPEVLPEVKYTHYKGPNGFQLSPHSGYMWALYFGGFFGLGILLILLMVAGRISFCSGYAGYVSGSLLIFTAAFMLVDTQHLLVGASVSEYLIFWIPLALAAGLSSREQNSCT